VGAERGIVPTRDTGMVIMGEDAIWGLAPSATPVATDKPQPLVTDHGVVSKKGWVIAGDDIYYFAQDGLRKLMRTQLDKLQTGASFPISYPLKTEYDNISWAYVDRLRMEYFDNKIFVSVPTSATTFDTWVYYPALNAFMVIQGWSPREFAKYKMSGQEYLYYAKHGNGIVYRAWYGYTDEGATTTTGTAINYQEEGRKEDGGQPLIYKVGGEVEVKALASGNYNLGVYVSFDDGSYNLLGYLNLLGNLITFPATFPLNFMDAIIMSEKFHLDGYGRWRQIRIKIQHNATNSTNNIIVLERSIISFPEVYETEE
jgi:hypothetical protein